MNAPEQKLYVAAAQMRFADSIDLTHVPDVIPIDGSVLFPEIDQTVWEAGPRGGLGRILMKHFENKRGDR